MLTEIYAPFRVFDIFLLLNIYIMGWHLQPNKLCLINVRIGRMTYVSTYLQNRNVKIQKESNAAQPSAQREIMHKPPTNWPKS